MKSHSIFRSPHSATATALMGVLAAGALLQSAYARSPGTNLFDNLEAGLGNWTQIDSTFTNLTLSTTQNKVPAGSGHSARATDTIQRMYASSLVPSGLGIASGSEPCRFTYWLYDGGNTRSFAEIRAYTAGAYDGTGNFRLVAIGKYNATTMPGDTWDSTKYQGRFVNGTPNGWFNLNAPGAPSRSTGWHKFEVERGPNADGLNVATFYVDGVVARVLTNSSDTLTWNSVVMGAGISSSAGGTGGDSYFDGFQVVSGQAYITRDPASQTLTVGSGIDLTVQAVGDADGPYYQWKQNGTTLPSKTDANLHFDSVAIADSGTYTVVVSNILAVKTSAPAVLTVNPPLFATIDPTNVLLNPGNDVTFTATAIGQGSITYQWNKNGSTLSGQTDPALTLAGVTTANAATYTVTVHNGIDPDSTSNPGVLTVNTAPSVPTPADTNASIGQAFSMLVAATDDFASQAAPFQAFETNAVGSRVTFANPYTSGTTEAYVDGSGRTYVTNVFPAGDGSGQVLFSHFTFTNASVNWMRFTTTDGSSSGVLAANPVVYFNTPLRFDIYTDKPLQIGLGMRESNSAGGIGSNGGTSTAAIEWAGVLASGNPPQATNIIAAGAWTTVVFPLPNVAVTSFNLGNGVLDSTTGKGILEDLCIADGTQAGQAGDYHIWLDNLVSLPTNALSFSLDAAPPGAAIDSATGVVTWTPSAAGNQLFTVRVTDDMGLASTTSFHVNATTAVRPTLSIAQNGSHVVLTWTDATYSLQAAPSASGVYTNVPGAVSGYNPLIGSGSLFFRLAK